jgi:transcriptional regulator with GAF, ATPase, and Fis domain
MVASEKDVATRGGTDISREARSGRSTASVPLRVTWLLSQLSAKLVHAPASEMDSHIHSALGAVGEQLELDRSLIVLFSADSKRIRTVYQWCSPGIRDTTQDWLTLDPAVMAFGLDRVRAGEVYLLRTPDDVPADNPEARALVAGVGTRSYAAVPFRVGHEVIGFMGFATVRAEREWPLEVVEALRLLGEILGCAYDRKRTEQALHERLAFEQLLTGLSTQFISAPAETLDQVIEESLRSICLSQSFDRTVVMLLTPDRQHLDFSYEWSVPGLPPSFWMGRRGLPIAGFGWPLTRVAAGETFVIRRDQLPDDADNARRVLDQSGARAIINVPLRVGDDVLGSISFTQIREGRPFPEELIGRLTLVGEIVANALMRQRIARSLREAELLRQRAFDEISQLKARIEGERDYLREEIRGDAGAATIIGTSPTLRRALELTCAVAATSSTVLIRGESGVGKELFARAIHAGSARADGPLVKVNCASIPESLFESEFFGHVRGAFTGAHKDRAGRFELADKGTLFLDEVGEIPLELQAKLLRVLQEGELERVGDDRTRKVDVRVVAATNRDLERDVDAGRFRRDLYYRLSVFPLEVPPLRERPEDIVPLAETFLRRHAQAAGRPGLGLTERHREGLTRYAWPGNVRELQHVIERAVILSRSPHLELEQTLPAVFGATSVAPGRPPLAAAPALPPIAAGAAAAPPPVAPVTYDELRRIERANLVAALERASWRVSGEGGAAELLGIRPSTLRDRMRAFRISRP